MDNGIRQSVVDFAFAVEAKLRENDFKGGWDKLSLHKMLELLKQEVAELEAEINKDNWKGIMQEAPDVGAIAHMFYNKVWTESKRRTT